MRVKSIMTSEVSTCAPETTLCQAAAQMREIDSGILPVIEDGQPVGVITDRDICLTLAECDRPATEVFVREAMSWGAFVCTERDGVREALATMRARRVRRLPVVDAKGRLSGILSMNDIIRSSEPEADGQPVSYADTIKALQHICEHRYPVAPAEPSDVTELARFL